MGRFQKVIDTEMRVLKLVARPGWVFKEGSSRQREITPSGRSRMPSCGRDVAPYGRWAGTRALPAGFHWPNRYEVWLRGLQGEAGFKVIPSLDALASKRAL